MVWFFVHFFFFISKEKKIFLRVFTGTRNVNSWFVNLIVKIFRSLMVCPNLLYISFHFKDVSGYPQRIIHCLKPRNWKMKVLFAHKAMRRLRLFHLHLPFVGPDIQTAEDSQKHYCQLPGPSWGSQDELSTCRWLAEYLTSFRLLCYCMDFN